MGFFNPTWRKVVIAVIFTAFPYIISYVLMLFGGGNIFSDNLEQLAFWVGVLSPIFLLARLVPNSKYYDFWQTEKFLFYGYPILSFLFWYLVSCIIVSLTKKLKT